MKFNYFAILGTIVCSTDALILRATNQAESHSKIIVEVETETEADIEAEATRDNKYSDESENQNDNSSEKEKGDDKSEDLIIKVI